MTDLAELLAKLEAAEGPDRELDACIRCALLAPEGAFVRQSTINGEWCVFEDNRSKSRGDRIWEPRSVPYDIGKHGVRFTSSIDAAVSLLEWVLPEFSFRIDQTKGGYFWVIIGKLSPLGNFYKAGGKYVARAKTPAIALCTAIVKAKMEQ